MPLKKTIKNFLYRNILPYIITSFIKLISSTYTITLIDEKHEKAVLEKGERPIYASWHQRFLPGVTFFNRRKPVVAMVSMSRDGDMMSKAIGMLGWHTVRGSSSKGGTQALKEIKSLTDKGYSVGHLVDGPRGPFGIVKPGIVAMARYSGMPVLPIIISPGSKWSFNSWDKFLLPKPFSKIKIKFGRPIYISRNAGNNDMEKFRLLIEEQLKVYYEEMDSSW
ncbi:MAG: lysophospholipid acyltransferase family protein [Spirochaetes bacterium]|nr:lysophospholipid acyltransferase family protein [Spirochaetota bacterium]